MIIAGNLLNITFMRKLFDLEKPVSFLCLFGRFWITGACRACLASFCQEADAAAGGSRYDEDSRPWEMQLLLSMAPQGPLKRRLIFQAPSTNAMLGERVYRHIPSSEWFLLEAC